MSIFAILFLIALFLLAAWYVKNLIDARGLPPEAPGSMFLLGHLTQLEKSYSVIADWGKTVGPIFRVNLGPMETWFVVTGYELIKEVLVKEGERFGDRPMDSLRKMEESETEFVDQKIKIGHGIINASGELWREQRRFVLGVLKEFGFGRTKMEDKLHDEIDKLLEWLDEDVGARSAVLDIEIPLKFCIANIISNIAMGRSYPKGDPEFLKNQAALDRAFKLTASPELNVIQAFPFLQRFAYFRKVCRMTEYLEANGALHNYWKRVVEEHKADFDVNSESENLVGAYLQALKRREEGKDGGMGHFSEAQLLGIIGDLWIAGMETTVHTLRWAILYMLHYEDVQQLCYKEIISVIGPNRKPTLEDRTKMPYVQATLQEAQRIGNIAESTLFHTCLSEDTKLGGYRIPAGANIVPYIYAVHMNPDYFPDPTRFDPTRFLDASGQLKKVEHWMPFGMGKRVCMGEGLARMELFLVFTALLQRFKFCVPAGREKPTLVGAKGFTLTPQPYECEMVRRETE